MRTDLSGSFGMYKNPFQARLLPQEKILWQGKPAQGIIFSGMDLFIIPMNLLWLGFVFFWIWKAFQGDSENFILILFGAAMCCSAVYAIFGRFLLDMWGRRGVTYAVTNKRILINRSGLFADFISINLDNQPDIQMSGSLHRGTLRFNVASVKTSGSWVSALALTPQFIHIAEPEKVLNIITRKIDAIGSKDEEV